MSMEAVTSNGHVQLLANDCLYNIVLLVVLYVLCVYCITPNPVSPRTLLAVAVPIMFILLIVIIVLVVLVACLAWKKRAKKSGESIPFQNMTGKLGFDEGDTDVASGKDGHEAKEGGEKTEPVV